MDIELPSLAINSTGSVTSWGEKSDSFLDAFPVPGLQLSAEREIKPLCLFTWSSARFNVHLLSCDDLVDLIIRYINNGITWSTLRDGGNFYFYSHRVVFPIIRSRNPAKVKYLHVSRRNRNRFQSSTYTIKMVLLSGICRNVLSGQVN